MNTKRFAQGVFAALIIPGAVYLIFALLRPDVFWRADVVYLLFIQSIESIILGWGMSFGMISGNMDLSVAAETILGTIVAAIAAKSFGVASGPPCASQIMSSRTALPASMILPVN